MPSQVATIGHAAFGGIARANAVLFRALGNSPRDAVGLFVALLAAGMILINALYMQPGPHPAPIFSVRSRPVAEPVPVMPRARPEAAPKVEPTPRVAAPRDLIAELIAPAPRVTAVQRALNDYGYGPLKTTGVYGPETVAAIERFERDRKLPVTGQISPRLMKELATVTGRPLE